MSSQYVSSYISEKGKNNLALYKYSGSDHSLISPLLQPFWNFSVTLLPESMAPNLVTLVGFLALIICYGLSAYHSPQIQGEIPTWVLVTNIFCLFWYQTLDAIDGKQARRTGSSSPLGELFDHGCDALGSLLQTMTIACVLQLGPGWWTFFFLALINFMFYMSIWEQYYTHVLHFHILAGPTEGEFVGMIVNLIGAVFGCNIFKENIFLLTFPENEFVKTYLTTIPFLELPFQLNYLFVLGILVTTIPALYSNISNVVDAPEQASADLANVDLESQDKVDKSVYKTQLEARYQSLPPSKSVFSFMAFFVCFLLYLILSPIDIIHTNTLLACSTFGVISGYLISRLVLARVCDERPTVIYLITLPLLLFTTYSVVMTLVQGELYVPANIIEQEGSAFFLYLLFVLIMYAHFMYDILVSISLHLNIYIFSLGKRVAKKGEIESLLEEPPSGEKQN
ncbi:ethanolaminephosphotransferase [Acrasis kona]|uniref:Ethanolaminephosphotransferase n=1 Tax=Acrasis kona TaxID=1008807 RepID=A0AAW2YPZ4_9EUKA